MKKVRFITLGKASIYRFFSAIIFMLAILYFNIVFLSGINKDLNRTMDTTANISLNSTTQAKLAVIIDDFGQNRVGVKEMMSINCHLTFAVMPFLTFSQSDADNAYEKGYEVIVHLPMEASGGKISWVGPKPILTVMEDNKIIQTVEESFTSVPHAVGANIHMGSKAGDDERIISDILHVIKSKNLYFVDSRSSRNPIAKKIADIQGVPCFDRNIFIDGKSKSKEYIKKQLSRAGDIALDKGYSIAIGHVGIEGGIVTAEAIQEMLPEFEGKNIQLVFVSELNK